MSRVAASFASAFALLFTLSGCSSPASFPTADPIRLAPTSVNDSTVPTGGFVAVSGRDIDADGDPSTCFDLGTAGTRIVAFPASHISNGSLNVISGVDVADGSITGGTASVSYSLDGGQTFVPIWSVAGASARPLHSNSIQLPHGQRTDLVQLKYSASMPPLHFNGCEVWISGS